MYDSVHSVSVVLLRLLTPRLLSQTIIAPMVLPPRLIWGLGVVPLVPVDQVLSGLPLLGVTVFGVLLLELLVRLLLWRSNFAAAAAVGM